VRSHPDWLPTESCLRFLREIMKHDLRVDDVRHFWSSTDRLEAAGLIKPVDGIWRPTHTGREVMKLWLEMESLLKKPDSVDAHSGDGQ